MKLKYGSEIEEMNKSEETSESEHVEILGKSLQYGSDLNKTEDSMETIHVESMQHHSPNQQENESYKSDKKVHSEHENKLNRAMDVKHKGKVALVHTGSSDNSDHRDFARHHTFKITGPKESVKHAASKWGDKVSPISEVYTDKDHENFHDEYNGKEHSDRVKKQKAKKDKFAQRRIQRKLKG